MIIYDTANISADGRTCDVIATTPEGRVDFVPELRGCDVASARRYVRRMNELNGVELDDAGGWHSVSTAETWTPGW